MALEQAIQLMLPNVPECAAQCIDAMCPGLNATESCICPHKRAHYAPWEDGLNDCLSINCTQNDYLITGGLTYHACGLPQWEMSLVPLIVVTTAVEVLFFSVRMWSTWTGNHRRGYDDISISIAFILLMCWVPLLCLEEHYGFYRNVWALDIKNLDRVTIVFFVYEIIYCLALGLTKISIAFMYFRILEGRKYAIMLWGTQVLNVLVICSFLIGLFLSCKPLARYWIYSYDTGGECSDLWDWGGYYLAFNLLLDIWLIAIPSSYVCKTSLDQRTKGAVIAMFCLGIVTMAMTIMRFVAMHQDADTIAGDDLMAGLLWSTLEVTTAFAIACMPATRLFVQHFTPVVRRRVSRAVSTMTGSKNPADRRGSSSHAAGHGSFSHYLPAKDHDMAVSAETHELREDLSRNPKSTGTSIYPV